MSYPRHPNHRPQRSLPPELRRTTVPAAVREWVSRSTGRSVERVDRLPGASSTAVHRIALSGGESVVLRRYAWPGFLEDEPAAPQRELEALMFASANGLSVPHVVAADVTGGEIGDGTPAILMTFVRGRALAAPDPTRLAEAAMAIHAVDPSGFAHEYFPWFENVPLPPLSATRRPRLWERALQVHDDGAPFYRPAFIHRDFHPGNVLWHRGGCSAVVDWANACRGPVGCDIATCRGNLITWAGEHVADQFVAEYEALAGERQDPYWEIASVLEHGPSPWMPQEVVECERRLERALAALGAL